MSLHSLLTVLLLIPDSPIACTRSSTRRVDTPPTPGFLDHRHQRLLRRLPWLQEGREIGALPQLRDAELQAPEPGVERTVTVTVAVGRAIGRPFLTPGANQP